MSTLHIEHAISDFGTWQAAFARLAPARERAGVISHRVSRPAGEPGYVIIDLDFASMAEAEMFLAFLHDTVWSSAASAPALAGRPLTRLQEIEMAAASPAGRG
ncbi:MAG TPA: hypothetical protein VH637_24165 [Streptosporangiaceae bacterium]|jgi:hypothetical protein